MVDLIGVTCRKHSTGGFMKKHNAVNAAFDIILQVSSARAGGRRNTITEGERMHLKLPERHTYLDERVVQGSPYAVSAPCPLYILLICAVSEPQ